MAQKVNSIVLSEMTDDDIRLCIQLLRGAEARTSALVVDMRDKPLGGGSTGAAGVRGGRQNKSVSEPATNSSKFSGCTTDQSVPG